MQSVLSPTALSPISNFSVPPRSHKGWLLKVKSSKARARWWSAAEWRFYTLDFERCIFFYSRSEDGASKAPPVHFSDIFGAELIYDSSTAASSSSSGNNPNLELTSSEAEFPPLSGSRGHSSLTGSSIGQAKGKQGFLVRTRSRIFEFYTAPAQRALEWVELLQSAQSMARHGAAHTTVMDSNFTMNSGFRQGDLSRGPTLGPMRTVPPGTGQPPLPPPLVGPGRSGQAASGGGSNSLAGDHLGFEVTMQDPSNFGGGAGGVNIGGGSGNTGGTGHRSFASSSTGDSFGSANEAPLHRQAPIPNHARSASAQPGWRPSPLGPEALSESQASEPATEEECQKALRSMPCEIRQAAASQCATWSSMTWRERLRFVKGTSSHTGSHNHSNGYSSSNGHSRGHENHHNGGAGLGLSRESARSSPDVCLRSASEEWGLNDIWNRGGGGGGGGGSGVVAGAGGSTSASSTSLQASHQQQWHHQDNPPTTSSERQRLRAIFDCNDGLRVLLAGRTAAVSEIIGALRPRRVARGEVLIEQGHHIDRLFIVDEGHFTVKRQHQNHQLQQAASSAMTICEHGPGSVFGESCLVSKESRSASVVATTPGRVWMIDRETVRHILRTVQHAKNLGLAGSIALFCNCIATSNMASMTSHVEQAGWFSLLLSQGSAAAMGIACALMMLQAIRRMQDQGRVGQRIEFANLVMHYLPKDISSLFILCYLIHMVLWISHLLVQASHVLDLVQLHIQNCTPAFDVKDGWRSVCAGSDPSVASGDYFHLSTSLLVIGIMMAPFHSKTLDDIVPLQYLAMGGLLATLVLWLGAATTSPIFPRKVPAVSGSPAFAAVSSLLSFGISGTVPTWVGEKRAEVPSQDVMGFSILALFAVHVLTGIVGAMGTTDPERGFLHQLNSSPFLPTRASVIAGPLLLDVTTIPIGCILLRRNLLECGASRFQAVIASTAAPLLLSAILYDGSLAPSIEPIGFVASLVVNFITPALLYYLSQQTNSSGRRPAGLPSMPPSSAANHVSRGAPSSLLHEGHRSAGLGDHNGYQSHQPPQHHHQNHQHMGSSAFSSLLPDRW
mmetsp:Transcript_29319/g.63595  ORF Transcript_29319/g.63595 Transcript_29319/m.63595 type:complete len:1067 (-) Transcript_29319:245-3445(-)